MGKGKQTELSRTLFGSHWGDTVSWKVTPTLSPSWSLAQLWPVSPEADTLLLSCWVADQAK